MDELATLALDTAVSAGAAYADVRAVLEETESLTVQDQRVEGVGRETTRGVGIRVLVDGAWGFAGTARLDATNIAEAARAAVAIARASVPARRRPIELAPLEVLTGSFVTPHKIDPFDVAVEEKLQLLLGATAAAAQVPGLAFSRASADAWKTTKWFLSSDGANLHQTLLQVAGGVESIAVDDTQVQSRSFPNSFRGYCATGGWEDIVDLDLPGRAPHYAEQAVAL